MSKEELIIEETTKQITISFNRPEAGNQFTVQQLEKLRELLDNPQEKILLLQGENGTFSKGRAPGERPKTIEEGHKMLDIVGHVNKGIQKWPCPTIAKLEGVAMGAALGLVMHCDFAIAADNTKMGFPEVFHGIAPAIVASYLPQFLGYRRAADLLLTGRTFSSQEALEMGIITQIAKPEELEDQVQSLLKSLLQHDLESLSYTKKALLELQDLPSEQRMDEGINRVISWLIRHP